MAIDGADLTTAVVRYAAAPAGTRLAFERAAIVQWGELPAVVHCFLCGETYRPTELRITGDGDDPRPCCDELVDTDGGWLACPAVGWEQLGPWG